MNLPMPQEAHQVANLLPYSAARLVWLLAYRPANG
jgi:hypothetical protein